MKDNVYTLMSQVMVEYAGEYLKVFTDNLKELSKQYPNDLEFGGEVRKLLNK